MSGRQLRTLRDLQNDDTHEGGTGSDSDEHETYYAGGEKSGVAMHGPRRGGDGAGSNNVRGVVASILRQSAQAPAADEETAPPRAPHVFSGAGYRLGSEDDPDVTQPAVPASGTTTTASTVTPAIRTLTFWRNGFTIGDDGPLRAYDAPDSRQILEVIHSGFAPPELFNIPRGEPVEIRVSRKLDEDYREPPTRRQAFAGSGNRLGDYSTATPPPVAAAAPTSQTSTAAVVAVDESQPTTTIQVRLTNGTRLRARLNLTQTVGDLYSYVQSQLPSEDASRTFILTVYPMRELTDRSITIKDAGLANAAVTHKFVS